MRLRLLRSLMALGLVAGACTLGARDDAELSGKFGDDGGSAGGSGGSSGDGGGSGGAGACEKGFADCDGLAANGCEAQVAKDPNNCGTCKTVCTGADGNSPTCVDGVCGVSNCTAPMADCDGDGTCETNTTTSVDHCQFCGQKCVIANATATCALGCQIDECSSGFENCDGIPSNGCETPLNTSVNCGSCGAACALANATASCTSGTCALTKCSPGFDDCDKLSDTGCESNAQTDPANCGTCGTKCSANQVCQAGKCIVSNCTPPTANCDANPADCETNTDTSVAHCGFCNNPCNLPNANAGCSGGKCTVTTCKAGFADCDGLPANGCETSLGTTSNCKLCGDTCSGGANVVTATCGPSGCAVTCAGGFSNCNGAVGDGCEVQLATDPKHCGSCAKDCAVGAPAGTQPGCTANACTYNCGVGTADCDKNGTCETNLNTSAQNCGVCGRSCGTTQCIGGFCDPEKVVTAAGVTSFDDEATGTFFVFGRNPGGVFRVAKSGFAVTTLTTAQPASWLDAAGAQTYFSNQTNGLFRVSTGGGAANQLSSNTQVTFLDYFSGDIWVVQGATGPALGRIPSGGGVTTVIDPTPGGRTVRADGQVVVWTVPAAGLVRYLNGNNVTTFATGQGEPSYVETDPTHVYWTNVTDGAVRRKPKPPAVGSVQDVATNSPNANALIVGETDVYWASTGSSADLWRKDKTGAGTAIKLAANLPTVTCLRVDSTHVYWSDSSGLKRVPK